MTHYTTTLSSINFSIAAFTTFLNLENINNLTTTTTATLFDLNATTTIAPRAGPPSSPYNLTQMIIIAIVFTILALLTVIGNFMVMISFKIDKQLQTISNYFLFSLAIADLAIGLISMPLFTVSTILGHWPLGPFVCDTWLALDYLASNASVLNLLIISFDRYFSVTRPLTYRAKRTTNRAAIMIASAWGISLLLWPPWIYSWPYIEGKRTVPEYECYIQFIETNQYITFGTAIAAFYVPVTVMCFLYYRIWRETKKRQKDLPNLQAGGGGGHQSIKKDSSKRSNSSDETSTINHQIGEYIDPNFWHPPHLAGDNESNSYYSGAHPHSIHDLSRRTSTKPNNFKSDSVVESIKNWCVAWWHSGQEEDSFEDFGDWCDGEGEQSYAEYGTPCSAETPVQSSVSRCTSLNIIRDPYARGSYCASTSTDSPATFNKNRQQALVATQSNSVGMKNAEKTPPTNLKRSLSQDSVYTILIRLPIEGGSDAGRPSTDTADRDAKLPSIKMFPEDPNLPKIMMSKTGEEFGTLKKGEKDPFAINTPHQSYEFNSRLPLNAKIIPRKTVLTTREKQQQKAALNKKKKSQEKRQESKAAKTLSAILLSFIITWTPYNILVLLKPITSCTKCIPQELWDFFYALCYLNSTINPVCYALCNASFRRTYVRILTCKWQSRNREAISRGVYN